MTDENKNKPVKKVRIGAIEAAVWKTTKDDKTFYNVKVERHYKDGEEWKSTTSFGANDIPKVQLALDECYRFIMLKQDE